MIFFKNNQDPDWNYYNDWKPLTALANGIDGWRNDKGFVMILNRGALTASSTSKKIGSQTTWHKSKNAK